MYVDYDEGRWMYFIGVMGIGMCGMVDVLCVYIMVFCESMFRLWSEYTYLCFEANEGYLLWIVEEIVVDNY